MAPGIHWGSWAMFPTNKGVGGIYHSLYTQEVKVGKVSYLNLHTLICGAYQTHNKRKLNEYCFILLEVSFSRVRHTCD